ncbi:DNA alkylation repair protein [Streptomyces sp. NBS 14/10]|uniref:DNA alkylation repair protein n=1 Tax=Streptomyces sp. NBS 14/10 TaxID=1945643 RepID=UPI000B7E1A75|nr:DNA alkylation repair protein [Streptomyces sp. NBS 14/10]KAK1183875.1 DNA alkylation repair protein [Streptomyces sp. NBS 14/10]
MPTADELISPDSIRQLAAILQDTSPSTSRWQTVADSSTTLGSLGLSERARTVGDALLADSGLDYPHLAGAVRKALRREDLTGWMIWPVTEAVATAATASGTTEHFDDGLALLAQLTPRLTGEFALRTFLNTDLERTLATASAWTGSPDPAVRRLASEGTRPKLPWARQVPELNRNPRATVPLLGELHTDTSSDVRRSVANHLNDISRLDPQLAAETAAQWMDHPAASTTPALVRHAMRTLVKKGDPKALELVGFHGSRENLQVTGPLLTDTAIPVGGTLTFTAHIKNVSDQPVSLAIDYVIHHKKANGKPAPKVFKLTKRNLAPGESADLARRHSFRPISTRVYYPGTHAVELQVNGQQHGLVEFGLGRELPETLRS